MIKSMMVLSLIGLSFLVQSKTLGPTEILGPTELTSPAAINIAQVCKIVAGVVTTGNSETTGSCNTTVGTVTALVVGWGASVTGNTYTFSSTPSQSWTCTTQTTSSNATVQICYACGPTTSSTQTFSVQSTGSTTRIAVGGIAVQNTLTSGCFDSSSGGTSAGTVLTVQPGSITPALGGELFYTFWCGCGVAGSSPTITLPFFIPGGTTAAGGGFNTASLDSGQAYFTQGTAAALNPTWTGSDQTVAAQMVTIKP